MGLPLDLTICSMFFITALSNSAYALVAPFLPFEFQRKGVHQETMGYIFAIYSLAVIIGSPMVGKLIQYMGRRNLISFGVVLMGLSFIQFGLLATLENKRVFIICAFVIRFLQGFASALI